MNQIAHNKEKKMSYFTEFEKYGNAVALLDDQGVTVTYAELAKKAGEIGAAVGRRTLVFSFCQNSAGSAVGYLSFLNNHIVPLMIDRKVDRELRQNLLDVYEPAYVYVPADMREEFADCRKVYEGYDYVLLRTGFSDEIEMNDELALLLTTSGSTGSPKLVRQSYTNIDANARSIVEYLELDATERPVTTLPMNYTYGLSILNSHMQVGATLLLTDKTMMMRAFWDFMKENKATSFGGVPFTYELLKKVRVFKMDLPDLRYMTQAGGKLSPELHREFAEWAESQGKRFIVMYGQTEATARMAYLPADKSIEKYGSMGIAIPGGRFTLIGVDGNEINEPEQVGELVYYGANVTLGYATCKADLAKGDERQGRLVTGDMAKVDKDGFYYIVGRKKRFLKIFGNRVNLDEIDSLVKTEFEGIDCASTGVDDHMKMFITEEGLVQEVLRFLSDKTHLSQSAFTVTYIPEIPKNEAGKTLYKNLPE